MIYENIPIIKKVVREMGGKMRLISADRYAYEIKYKGYTFLILSKFVVRDSYSSSISLTKLKDLTYLYLDRARIKTPKTTLISSEYSLKKIKSILSKFKTPFVIKDARGSNSKGVFTNINSVSEGVGVLKENLKCFGKMIVQEMVFGQEYRVLVLGNRILAVLKNIPPFIVGDGKTCTQDLIKQKQTDTHAKTPFDRHLKSLLSDQGEKLSSIPKKDKQVFIKRNACLAEGGVSVDCTEKIGPYISKVCIKATKAMKLKLAGIDLLSPDLEDKGKKYSIIEINGKPDIFIHHIPVIGKPRNVTKEIIKFIATNAL